MKSRVFYSLVIFGQIMNLKEIVYCYVSKTTSVPSDMDTLRASFVENGFRERTLNESKWLYKRGAPLALEFNYNSEAIEIQVILEKLGNELEISVGNWGFPFEPLLMKRRFERNLSVITDQIETQGRLSVNCEEVTKKAELSKRKGSTAKVVLLVAVICAVVLSVVGKT